MFKPLFSTAFVLIWGVIFTTIIALVWWGTGQYPTAVFRAFIGTLSGFAAQALEADLARRYARRKQLPSRQKPAA